MVDDGPRATTHRIVQNSDPSAPKNLVSAPVQTLDAICTDHGVERISYLKVDTEGFDLDVLKGGTRMLTEQRVDLIEVEAGMNPRNHLHVPFEELKSHLEAHSYVLFGMYEQVWEWPSGAPNLRRTNCVYMADSLTNGRAPRR